MEEFLISVCLSRIDPCFMSASFASPLFSWSPPLIVFWMHQIWRGTDAQLSLRAGNSLSKWNTEIFPSYNVHKWKRSHWLGFYWIFSNSNNRNASNIIACREFQITTWCSWVHKLLCMFVIASRIRAINCAKTIYMSTCDNAFFIIIMSLEHFCTRAFLL